MSEVILTRNLRKPDEFKWENDEINTIEYIKEILIQLQRKIMFSTGSILRNEYITVSLRGNFHRIF